MKQYLALKASAGSGKTFALTVRYITLLLMNARPKEILTLTFTNKAANEMSERIYHTLLHLGDDEAYLEEISKESGFPKERIISKKEFLLNEYTNSSLSIFTIDRFVNKILREFCGYIGLSDDFEIKEDNIEFLSAKFLESLDEKNFDKLIDFSLYEKKKYSSFFDIFKNLLEKNEEFIPLNIDADLISVQKNEVLKEAFKIKEMILNCDVASPSAKKAVNFENFEQLLGKTWLSKNSLMEYSYFKKCSNDILENYFRKLKKKLTIYYKIRGGYSLSRIFELYELYKSYKFNYNRAKNHLHFNDISNLTYSLLNNKIDRDFLYFRLDSKFSHILIDEFQDTSLMQYKILKPLIEEILSGSSEEFKSFFYVGDTKQSIYRFRGGKRELFDYVLKTNPLIEVKNLNTNYRSCKAIIDYVNSKFSNLNSYDYFDQFAIKEGGFVEVFEDEKLLEEEKFSNIAKQISNLMQNGVNSNDIAILTYTNEDVLNIYSYLRKMFPSLKITTEMTSKLINQENVKAVINIVKYLYFKEDIYKENANAIIGKKPNSDLNLDINIEKLSIQELIYKLAKKINVLDDNVVKLVELSSSYKNIVNFVYEIDFLDASIQNSEQLGLQILTIFKSKGLEFHTVLLLDRLKKKNADRSSLLFEYDEISLKNIYYKISGLENYNDDYKNALEKEKKLEFEDELNILYVAMTRAKNNMLIFKKPEKSVFDLLDLKVEKIGEIVRSDNKSKNYEKLEKIVYSPLALGSQDKPISKDDMDEEYSLHSKYFGIATHYCLEMTNSFDEESLKNTMNLVRNRYSSYLNEKDFKNIENRVLKLFENEFFSKITKNASFDKELSLIYKNELKIIDLLVQKDKKFYIFDYKTTKDELQEHIYQVNYYKKAIKKILASDEVYSYIIYLKEDKTIVKEV